MMMSPPTTPPHTAGFIIMLAEVISAGKRALSRMLLVIVSLGFGTVKLVLVLLLSTVSPNVAYSKAF